MKLSRREFINVSGAGLASALIPRALASVANAVPPAAAPGKRPNILYIWTDEQTYNVMSNAGNRWLKTPAMDSLARDGVTFERCYSADPISVPSRTSWLTGRMPHETGVLDIGAPHNRPALKAGVPALSRLMKDAGYDTGYVGKWHIPTKIENNAWNGLDYIHELTKAGGGGDFKVPGLCETFLKQKRDKPFFLVAAFVNPHDICEWARMASGMKDDFWNGTQVSLTPPLEQCPPLPDNLAIPEGEPSVIREEQRRSKGTYPVRDWPPERWRQYLWAYYRLTEAVDAQIGKLLRTLKETGQDDNTLIIFSSDHGDGMGAHQWNQKNIFYEECVRIPFIVRPPRAGTGAAEARAAGLGRRDTKNFVSMNLDFFPTVFDYAGIKTPAGLRGITLRPLVEGRPNAKAHEFAFSVTHLIGVGPKSASGTYVLGRMLRTERYKYLRFSSGENREQFFDLQNDPGELIDLKKDATHAAGFAEHRALMDKWLRDTGDPLADAPGWGI